MKTFLLLLALCLPAVAFSGTPGEVEVGSYLREGPLNGLMIQSSKLSAYRGKPLIINVWASWCSPCRSEMASLQRLANRYGGKKFNVIGISTDDYPDAATGFLKQAKITFPNYIDSKLFWENMLGANAIPLTLLVDARGRVVEKVRGVREWDSPEVLQAIGKALQVKM